MTKNRWEWILHSHDVALVGDKLPRDSTQHGYGLASFFTLCWQRESVGARPSSHSNQSIQIITLSVLLFYTIVSTIESTDSPLY